MAKPEELVFAPLGGVGEIGMNLSIYGLGNRQQRAWLAIDLGVSFGDEEHLPGIDLIMPDVSFLEKERKNLMGLVLTHAHEDHFGAIIDLWPKLKCPIYATRFSAALFEAKCAAERNAPKIPVTVIASGGRVDIGPFNVEFIPVAHSIPESHALAIHTVRERPSEVHTHFTPVLLGKYRWCSNNRGCRHHPHNLLQHDWSFPPETGRRYWQRTGWTFRVAMQIRHLGGALSRWSLLFGVPRRVFRKELGDERIDRPFDI
jgi:hypothetical protein